MVLALTCSISSIAWLNPEIKNGKVIIKNASAIRAISAAITAPEVALKPATPKHKKNISIKYYTDSSRLKTVNDTVIKNKKYKIVIEDENGTKKEYNSLSELPEEDRNDFYKNTAGTNYHITMADSAQLLAMKKFYTSDKWKKQSADIQAKALLIAKQFDSPEWKRKQKALVDQSLAMAKKMNTKEWKKQNELLALQAEKLAKHFDSPEWKKQQEEYAKIGEEYGNKFINSPEWKKQQEDIVKASLDLAKQFTIHFSEKDQKQLEKQAEELGKQAEKMTMDFDVKYQNTPKGQKLKSITLDPPPAPAKGKKIRSMTLTPPPAPALDAPKPEKPEVPEAPEKKEPLN